jgi:hypothetical protein
MAALPFAWNEVGVMLVADDAMGAAGRPPPPPQGLGAEALLRGTAGTTAKSVELLSVSAQPFAPRVADVVVFGGPEATEVSKQLAVAP